MRYSLLFLTTLCLLAIPVADGYAGAAPPNVKHPRRPTLRVVPLGSVQGWQAKGVLTLIDTTDPGVPSNAVGSCNVRVHYLLTHPSKTGEEQIRTATLDACESYYDELRTEAYDFTGSGHRQLLVSTRMGRVCTHIYNLSSDGKGSAPRLRLLYVREEGRVEVHPVASQHHRSRYDLEEFWPRRQWDDSGTMGVGRYDPPTNCVQRRLHWNGKAFVPDHPGPSRIVKQNQPLP